MSVPSGPRPHKQRNQYLLGLGLGLIPLLIFLALFGTAINIRDEGTSISIGLLDVGLGGMLYLVAVVAMIICLTIARVRFVGYGLLTAIVVSPIIAIIGCNVISTLR